MKKIKTEELDQLFDEGKDTEDLWDWENAVRGNPLQILTKTKKVNVDFPEWMIIELDREANRLGINRQAAIKTIIDEALKMRHGQRKAS